MQFYIKGDDGDYSEVTQEQLENEFKPRYERFKKSETPKIRSEVEKQVRDELTPTLTEELTEKVKKDFQPKLDDANSKISELETTIRQKTIAAEYGFKSGTEKYLGTGTDEEMRKEADQLKKSFGNVSNPPKKTTTEHKSTNGFVTKVD